MAFSKEQRQEIVSQIVANGKFDEGDSETLLQLTDNQLVGLAKPDELDELVDNATKVKVKTKKVDDDKEEEDEEEMETNRGGMKKKKKDYTANEGEQVSLQDWMESAPPEIQRMVSNAQRIEKQEREQLVEQITANEGCPFTAEELNGRSTEDLQMFARMASAGSHKRVANSPVNFPNFAGAAGVSPTANRQADGPKPMGLPPSMLAEDDK